MARKKDSAKADPAHVPGDGLPAMGPDEIEQELGVEMDNVVPSRGYDLTPMVGLGGSAGSIGALQEFFKAMPADSGFVFVVILHLSPEHESTMADLLGRVTTMRVVQAVDGQKVEPNCVYVIPPGKHLASTDGRLGLTDLDKQFGTRVAVDLFFRTLADSHGPHSAAIVLSGADGDGAIGIKRIKERGGLTIAQDPDEASHGSMPRSAIATGMVDWVLKVGQMPGRLMEYAANEQRLKLPSEEGPQPAAVTAPPPSESEKALREVLVFLRSRTGRDFTYYKRATILRRISRRMQVNGVTDMPGYLDFLRTHPGEAGALFQELLVSVTNFFRDREAFAALEARVPALFAGKGTGDVVRVWVPACATGEEAYSLAILLCEHAGLMDSPPALQIFATDLAEDAVATGREGLYPPAITADVSETRLRRFFVKEHRGYRVKRELREMVLFAVHDLLKDSPFSRLDLVSCRNLLIYFTREAQSRAFQTIHFALRPGGLLFLGTSETVDEESTLFMTEDKKHRIFTHRPASGRVLPVPFGPSTFALTARDVRSSPVIHGAAFSQNAFLQARDDTDFTDDARTSWEELHFRLIERFAPPSLIVDRDYEIMHISENAGRFLRIAGGEPSLNLMRVVHPMLRVELRAALFRAAQTSMPVEVFRVPVEMEGVARAVDIRVSPAQEIAPDCLLVILSPREEQEGVEARPVEAEPAVRHLERELEQMKTRLRDTVEQYEASTEELKASNEELQAMNEELRSATEELETSREELQSINEELITVNQELKTNVDELGHANSDLNNLMAATAIGIVFVDRSLHITRYTPSAVAIFHLIPGDIGRPLSDLQHRLDYPELRRDAERVIETLVPVEREVKDGTGRWFLSRLLPYRTEEDLIAGAVLTFVDITDLRQVQSALQESEGRLALIIENAREYAIFSTNPEMIVTSWNPGAERLLGYHEKEIIGKSADLIFTPEDRVVGAPEAEKEQAVAEGRATDERWHLRKDGTRFWGSGYLMLMRGAGQKIIGFAKILRDLTEAKQTEETIRAGEEHFRALIRSVKDYAIFTLDAQGRITDWNTGAEQITGYKAAEVIGRDLALFYPAESLKAEVPRRELEQAAANNRSENEGWLVRKDGSLFWAHETVNALHDEAGGLIGFAKVCRDLTERNKAEEALRSSQMELEKRVRARTADLRRANRELSSEIMQRTRLETEILGVSEREQRRIGQDLHDGVCQELAANAFMTSALAKRLAQKHVPESEELAKVAAQINEAVGRTRDIARGLHPVEMDSNGLMSALTALVGGVNGGIKCRFLCKTPVLVDESSVAMNLYRIAQEAVTNAVKHSNGTRIVVDLARKGDTIKLVVRDNGTWSEPKNDGMGLDIMNYRARTIGGSISISHLTPHGTRVTCLLPIK
ncbi:MAG: two-component system, chemotaxis family, CheB/CheR fusion protein [Chthoniobacter sp.]|jgi:two-component system CheB/CheR fusion protein|nr:two-component system, chemotaxis family, CheB/CheR fusion protein [Chthoniobacter sp.]